MIMVYRPRDPQATSKLMSAVRSEGNRAEVLLRKGLWSLGFRYRLYSRKLVGKPDIVLPRWRTVVFVDGDFWHGRVLLEHGVEALRSSLKTNRREWWVQKIMRTTARDGLVTDALERSGWRVIRVWETDVLRRTDSKIKQVATAIELGQ